VITLEDSFVDGIMSLLEGSSSVTAVGGVYTVTNLFITALPSSEQTIYVFSNAFALEQNIEQSLQWINIEMRGCLVGESYTTAGR
jgi:hypothetical protein